jgi:hypothetical protein
MSKILASGHGFGGVTSLPLCASNLFVEKLLNADESDEVTDYIWCYRAPWAQVADSGSAATLTAESPLTDWLVEQRKVLNLRQRTAAKVWFINVDRASFGGLLAELGVAGPDTELSLFPKEGMVDGFNTALAKLFELMAPEYWDAFESLESIAWFPGGEPLFRHTLPYPPERELFSLLRCVQSGLALPHERHEHESFRRKAKGELELLRQQLLKAQKELEHSLGAKKTFEEKLAWLQKDIEDSATLATRREDETKAAVAENELLLLQLHQVQEELEMYFLDNTTLKEQIKQHARKMQKR